MTIMQNETARLPFRASPSTEDDLASMIRRALGVVRRRLLTLVAVFALVFCLIFAVVMLMTPRYVATVIVKIDPKPAAMNGVGSDQSATIPDSSIVDTEVNVISSRDIAREVVGEFNLGSDPEFTKGLDPHASPAQRSELLVTAVLKELGVQREKETYLVDISFKSVSADTAAKVANGFAEAYIKQTVSRRTGTAEQQYKWMQQRLGNLADQTHAADAALAQYKASNGLTEGGQLGTVTDQQIAPLSSQLATAQANAASARSDLAVARQQMAAGGASAASSVLNSPAMQTLRASRASTVQTLSQLSARYGPKHPQAIQAQQQLEAIDAQIGEEATRITGELQAKAAAAQAQAQSLGSDLATIRSQQAGNARSAVTADSLSRDADAKHNAYNRLADLTQQIDQSTQSSLSQAQIIESAAPPTSPSSPKKVLFFAAGFLFAAAAGIGTIGTQEMMSGGFMTTQDVESQLELPYLVSIPRINRGELKSSDGGTPSATILSRPVSPYSEAFRNIRSSLRLSQPIPQVIAIASSLPTEGKTTSALSLARVMAMSGDRTLVIDGDVRRTGLGSLVNYKSDIGLVEVLEHGLNPSAAIIDDVVPGLHVLVARKASFITTDIFGGSAFAKLLTDLRGQYDQIVIDTPPLLGVADARTLASAADAVILAVKWNETTRPAVKRAVSWLKADGAPVVGVILTMVAPNAEAYGALYYSKAYGSYYQAN